MTHGPRYPDWTKTDLSHLLWTSWHSQRWKTRVDLPPETKQKRAPKGPKKKTDGTASFFTVNLGWTNAIWFVELTRWWGDFFPEQKQQWLNMADEQVFWGNVLHYLYYVLSTCTLWRPTCIKKKTQVHKKKKKRDTCLFFSLCFCNTSKRFKEKKKGLGWIFCSEWICRAGFRLFFDRPPWKLNIHADVQLFQISDL